MNKITPFLWFDNQAEEAAEFYTSIFKNSKIGNISRYGEGSPGPAGSVMAVNFHLDGQEFTALNGGPHFNFTPAISFFVHCNDQEEVDHLWNNLSADKAAEQCGWLKDKFGISWQIVPGILMHYLQDKDPQKANRVMQVMLQMKKIDIPALQKAYQG